jgi:hypothetical protein
MAGFWIRIAPSGHVCGSVYASALEDDSAEEAHREFVPKAVDRRHEVAEGWRHERVDPAAWKRRAEPCITGRCGHGDGRKHPAA